MQQASLRSLHPHTPRWQYKSSMHASRPNAFVRPITRPQRLRLRAQRPPPRPPCAAPRGARAPRSAAGGVSSTTRLFRHTAAA